MRQEKTLLLDEIKDKIDGSSAIVLTNYKALNPNLAADFRTNLSKSGGSFEVVKKRILMKAAEKSGISLDRSQLQGHIGVIFAEQDPVQTTKYLYEFSKKNNEIFQVLGGRFEGKLCTAQDVEIISRLPGQDEMRSQLLGLFEAPMSQTLSVIDALLCSVVHCLENKAGGSETSESETGGSEEGQSSS